MFADPKCRGLPYNVSFGSGFLIQASNVMAGTSLDQPGHDASTHSRHAIDGHKRNLDRVVVRSKSSSFRWLLIAALGLTLVATGAAGAGDAPPEPDSSRQSDYRAPTPATLKGARVLTTDEAAAMWRAGDSAFIDVLPQAPRPKDLPADVVFRDKPRSDIPGSLWLPDTGYGELAPVMLDYFRRGLDKALGGRPRPLVFYCLKDCWMSWNAAKRALALGYTNVTWYPEGSDGWAAAGLPVEKRTPEPRP
jgi:PQQ-dependent catabolism-associated CXXCW motif protein